MVSETRKIVRSMKKNEREIRTPIATEMYLPNLSEIKGGQESWTFRGKVGIGTTTPIESLDIVGGNARADRLILSRGGAGVEEPYIEKTGNKGIGFFTQDTQKMDISVGGNFDFFAGNLTTTGNVTAENLNVATDIKHTGDSNTEIQFTPDQFNFVTGGSTRFTMNNLGVLVSNGVLDMNSNKITELTDPTANQEAATKKYVDDNAGGNTEASTAAGQLLFGDGGGAWDHTETSEIFWDDTNKRLGIGTASPSHNFHIVNTSATIGLESTSVTVADEKRWFMQATFAGVMDKHGLFIMGTLEDDGGIGESFLVVDRVGDAIGTVTFNQGKVKINESLQILGSADSPPATNTIYKENIPKGWVRLEQIGTQTIIGSFNVSGVSDNGTGGTIITWDRDFANANYAGAGNASSGSHNVAVHTYAVGSVKILVRLTSTQANVDSAGVTVIAMGDQ
ncbi:hypothetical protein LCGC14_0956330 [marine sediment metagenome]|uniref:Uncharacterized protein n=1 Tax=marine sediment metagenome TaxID=412755 RepID=A0A0F9P1Z7_9ZZZZ